MTIEEVIDLEVMQRIAIRGCIKGLDPYAEHLLKTSENPLMRFRRNWIRRQAIIQCKQALARQKKLNSDLAKVPQDRKSTMWQKASYDPWIYGDMRQRHNTDLADKDFEKFVKREDPQMYPKRELV